MHDHVRALACAAVAGVGTARGRRTLWLLVKILILAAILSRSIPAWMVGPAQAEPDASAALLVVLGVLVERWNTVVPVLFGHAHPLYAAGGYAPTTPEPLLTVVAYAVGFVIYLSLTRPSVRAESFAHRVDSSL